MKIDTIVIGDFHWDALDAVKQFNESKWILDFIKEIPHLDLVVIAGDYFDTKMLLNSKSSLYSLNWMASLVKICKERHVKIRIVRGTVSHDNNQLDAFNSFEEDDHENFKIIRQCTFEETFPNFKCLYCPDETIPTKEYMDLYHDTFFMNAPIDAMFFHGSFDVVVPNIVIQESEDSGINNVIFNYSFFSDICNVMVGGHWHDGDNYEHMYYTRSINRWCFGEPNSKGFVYLTYDTDNKSYNLQRIENIFTNEYKTLQINTKMYRSIDQYRDLIYDIDNMLARYKEENPDKTLYIRLKIVIDDDKIDNNTAIEMIKKHYMNKKNIKFLLKDALKDKKKKEDKKKNDMIKSEFSFIRDKNKTIPEIIQEFILHQKGKAIPIDVIEDLITKYLK